MNDRTLPVRELVDHLRIRLQCSKHEAARHLLTGIQEDRYRVAVEPDLRDEWEELLQAALEKPGSMPLAVDRAQVYVDDIEELQEGTKVTRVGAPPVWDWPPIIAEVAIKVALAGGPKALGGKEPIIAKLQEVAKGQNGREPKRSTAQPYAHAIEAAWQACR